MLGGQGRVTRWTHVSTKTYMTCTRGLARLTRLTRLTPARVLVVLVVLIRLGSFAGPPVLFPRAGRQAGEAMPPEWRFFEAG